MGRRGAVAAGHESTARAAEMILREGGNAFDAIVAGHFAACVAEPVLASLGGGGFMLAHPAAGRDVVYDFFVDTPLTKRPATDVEFRPIAVDFGTATQEFHIGLGAAATPGTVKGLFAVHRELCSLPLKVLTEPALQLARDGVTVNDFQAYIFEIVSPILTATESARAVYASGGRQALRAGELMRQRQLADTMEILVSEGERLFYEGEIAHLIADACRDGGGHLGLEDLRRYEVRRREPLAIGYRKARILSNPPPSSGGLLIGFGLNLLEGVELARFGAGSAAHLDALVDAMALTTEARLDACLDNGLHPDMARLLDPVFIETYRDKLTGRARSRRGTTHISVIDDAGNAASLSTSNGEGCGHILADTGIMLNNMLGEQDLNPRGFHRWPPGQRMTSMMAPSLVQKPGGAMVALGSGGSNRIRTAILQVLVNLIDFDMPVADAVCAPRLHFEDEVLSVEGGIDDGVVEALRRNYPDCRQWPQHNLFFGGTHVVARRDRVFSGAGDPRRGGCAIVVD